MIKYTLQLVSFTDLCALACISQPLEKSKAGVGGGGGFS